MPPRKKGPAAKAEEPTVARSTRANAPVITTKNGKEIDSTAAATRSRRESAVIAPADSTPANKPNKATTVPKKRGRPAKAINEDEPPAKRGRPAKATTVLEPTPKKRGPGRPPKKSTTDRAASTLSAPTSTGKKRGRPAKPQAPVDGTVDADAATEEEQDIAEQAPPKKRGRPTKTQVPAVPEEETAPPKSRGQPPTGGETTKIDTDDGAAAEQLEVELQDTAEYLQGDTSSKRKAPTVSKKSKGAKGKALLTQADEDEEAVEAPASGRNYWLMKAEQEDRDEILEDGSTFNTKFTIDDLKAKEEPEPWDGVRNPTAAKNMREMKKGDLAFFYASGGKSGRKPGIVGTMEIVKEHEPDQTAWDQGAYGYVKDEKARSRWCVVHVEFRQKLVNPVHLSELQKHGKEGGPLFNLQELKAARLSVSKVTEPQWNFIQGLIASSGGYEDEGKAGAAETATALNGVETNADDAVGGKANGDVVEDPVLPKTVPAAIKTIETADADIPSTDGVIADGTSATSRPHSRAGSARASSRQPSLAPLPASSSRPGSRAGCGRSKTPNPPVPVTTMVSTDVSTTSQHLAGIAEEGS